MARIADNGNQVAFNFYSAYDKADPLRMENGQRLLDQALRVREKYPEVVLSVPFFIETMITGKTPWGEFGYDVCPSVSSDHVGNAERMVNGNIVLPKFNHWASDLKTVNFCCTSGHCDECRDSQAVLSWLLCSPHRFAKSSAGMDTWIEVATSYWKQFLWSPFYTRRDPPKGDAPTARMFIPIASERRDENVTVCSA